MGTVTDDDIVEGLRNGEFFLHYQPKASLISNRIIGAEAHLQDGSDPTVAWYCHQT